MVYLSHSHLSEHAYASLQLAQLKPHEVHHFQQYCNVLYPEVGIP